jgi:hypothetical protein
LKLIAVTDRDGVSLLLEAMAQNNRYDVGCTSEDLRYERYQVAIIPVSDGVRLNKFYQTQWDRVDYDDIDPPYYVMPLLSGLRVQLHISDRVKMFCSNGSILQGTGLYDVADSIMSTCNNSIYEAVWRKDEGVCYVTDVVMSDGVSLFDQPFSSRYKELSDTNFENPIRMVPIEVIDSGEDLDDFMSDKGSAVIRDGNSATSVTVYQLEDIGENGRNQGIYIK